MLWFSDNADLRAIFQLTDRRNERPTFEMSEARVGLFCEYAPHKQRDAVGEAAVIYWEIRG